MLTLPPLRDIPVAVYRSTDNAAPVLKGEKGSFKTLLKAVLVTGYGDKPSLGWKVASEDANTAVFQSQDATSNKHLLKIDHNQHANYVVTTGGTRLNADGSLQNFFGRQEMAWETPIADGQKETPWVIVGHSKAFIVLLQNTYNNYFGSVLYFGDVPSYIADDMMNTVLFSTRNNYSGFDYNNNNLVTPNFPANHQGIMGDTVNTPTCAIGNAYSNSTFGSMGTYAPNTTNQVIGFPIYFREDPVVRGLFSGIFCSSLLLPVEWNLQNCPLPNFEDYIVARLSENQTQSSILVNTVSWLGV
ncbi:MAG: hypothetical protein IJV35_11280 [Neisseriaceae bacterium]|nr:hypothetical protein [Neisseriaceae bacterium]